MESRRVIVDPSPQVILIAGPNGAGKSTLAPYLLRDEYGPMEFINADTIAQGLSAFRPESVAFDAGRIMLSRLHALAKQRAGFAFESTLASRSYASWLNGLRQHGYEFHLLFLWLRSPELAIQRVKARVRAGGHNVPESVIRRRYISDVRNFFGLYQSLADAWVIYDNSDSSAPVVIATGSGGSISRTFEENSWQQFVRLGNERGT